MGLLSSAHAQQNGGSGSPSALPVGRAATSIQLDGKLDEAAWQGAKMVVELVQQSPKAGAPTSYRTRVRVLVQDNQLYFGFECTDPNPHVIAVHTMQRDGNLQGDDTVSIVLDMYGDHRTGYFFRVNAAGARVDGLIAGSEEPRLDWDGIWDARTARTHDGWTAEIAIPANTLSFTRGLTDWGVNFERNIPRDRTVLRWASPTLDSTLYDLSRAGPLVGVGGLEQGRGIEVSPFAVGRVQTDFRQGNRVWQAQLELGGVTARLLWFGGAHTKGDELTFVEPDRTLVSGDVVQNKIVPGIFRDGGTPSSWLAVLDKAAALNALHVLPDHSAPGDGSMVALEKQFISDLRNSALELKKQGVAVDDAGKRLEGEFKTKYPTWPNMNVSGFVRNIYAE